MGQLMNKIISTILSSLFLIGCAGSASHKVVKTDPVQDQNLSCDQADAEIARSQAVINGVNEDKSDVSGSDVMDGLLWFPFNLIAKSSNYNNALTAANQRIISLKTLKQEKGCPTDVVAEKAAIDDLEAKMQQLDSMYANKLLTDEEYKQAKLKLLGIN